MSKQQSIIFPIDGHLPLVQGDTWPGARFQVNIDGSPANLTGSRIDIHLYQNMRKTKVLSTATGEIAWLDQSTGSFQIEPTTLNLNVGQHVGDLQFTDASGNINTWAKIILNISKEYTK